MKYSCPDKLKNKRIITIDIETTGLDIQLNTIIQMGVVEFQNGVEVLSYETMFGGGHSPLFLVRRLHKISDSKRKSLPSFKEKSEKIANYLSNSLIVTHNGTRFDLPFIHRVLKEGGHSIINSEYVDTFTIAKKIGHESNSLENLSKQYGLLYDDKNHTGLADARNTLELYFCFLNKYPELC